MNFLTSDQTIDDMRRELHQHHQQMGLTMQSVNKYVRLNTMTAKALQDLGEEFMALGQIVSEDGSGKVSFCRTCFPS